MNAVLQNPKFRNYVLPLLLIVAVFFVWEFAKRPPKPQPQQAEDYGPPPPRNANEELHRDSRMRRRDSTLKTLDSNWSIFCTAEGRKRLKNSLNEYYYFREGSEMSYPARWGEVGKTYITREFSTPEDTRIVQRIRELYMRGYLEPTMFDKTANKRAAALVQGMKAERNPCPPPA